MGEEDKQEEKEDRTIYLIMLILESINLYAESETLTKIALTIIILVLDEGLMMKRIIDWCMEIRMKDLRSGIFMTLIIEIGRKCHEMEKGNRRARHKAHVKELFQIMRKGEKERNRLKKRTQKIIEYL